MLVIDNGDAIRGIAEVIEKLDFIVNGYVGTTATQLADGQLGNSEGDLYQSGANATVVTSITIVNTDSVARTFTLYLKPSGGTSRAITPVSLDLGVGYSFYTDGQRAVTIDLSGNLVSSYPAHKTSHETGGADEINDVDINAGTIDGAVIGGAAACTFTGAIQVYDAGGETISGDGSDMTLASDGLINLTATDDVVIPVNVGLHLGDGAEKLESNNTDLTINSGADINLTATLDVNIPSGVGVTFGNDGEKIEGNGTDLTIAGNNINLTADADVVIPANIGVTFGSGEKIEGDNTNLTVTSGGLINLTATTGVTMTGTTTINTALTGALRADSGVVSVDKPEKVVYIKAIAHDTALATGDDLTFFTVPDSLNGMNLVDADIAVYTTSSATDPSVQLSNHDYSGGAQDMLSTTMTIDAGGSELSSYTAATPPVINGTYDDVATGDRISIDVKAHGTGTKGLDVILTFQLP